MSDVYAKGLESLDAVCDDTFVISGTVFDRLKLVRDVVKGLVGSGVVSARDVWTWIPIILQLIQTLGPLVQEILDKIKDAIGKGQTVETFAA